MTQLTRRNISISPSKLCQASGFSIFTPQHISPRLTGDEDAVSVGDGKKGSSEMETFAMPTQMFAHTDN